MTTDCNCKNVTINVCGCCGQGNGSENLVGVQEIALYEHIINVAGTYQLSDNINNYDDVFIIHEYGSGNFRQSTCMPVRCLGESQLVCYGNQSDNSYIIYSFDNDSINISTANNSYRIVAIIGRKYNAPPINLPDTVN